MASAPAFPDRRAEMFGREPDIHHLIARAEGGAHGPGRPAADGQDVDAHRDRAKAR